MEYNAHIKHAWVFEDHDDALAASMYVETEGYDGRVSSILGLMGDVSYVVEVLDDEGDLLGYLA